MALRARFLALAGPIFLSAALVAGCSGDSNASPDTTSGTRAPNPPAGAPSGLPSDDAPGTTATANGATVDMGIGTHCWIRMCVDMIGPVTKATLNVAHGDIIEVAVPSGAPALREVSAIAFPRINAHRSRFRREGMAARRRFARPQHRPRRHKGRS